MKTYTLHCRIQSKRLPQIFAFVYAKMFMPLALSRQKMACSSPKILMAETVESSARPR